MKFAKFLLIGLTGLLSMIFLMILILYFNLGLIINVERLKWAIEHFEVFKSYSWKDGAINLRNEGFVSKKLDLHFKDFCFKYDKDAVAGKGCFSEISLNATLSLVPPFVSYQSPLKVLSDELSLRKKVGDDKPAPPAGNQEIDVLEYYNYLWNPFIPNLVINFKKISVQFEDKNVHFPLIISKDSEALDIESSPLYLSASQEKLSLFIRESIKLPFANLNPTLFKADLNMLMGKEIILSSFILLEFIETRIESKFPSSFETDKIEVVISNLLKNLKLNILIPSIKKNLEKTIKGPYASLPAPLNEMEGDITFNFGFTEQDNFIHYGKGELLFDLKSERQILNLSVFPEVKISAKDYSYRDLNVNMFFNKVLIELPKFSKKSLPPQVVPDARFKSSEDLKVTTAQQKGPAIKLDLLVKAEKESSLQLKTNFIDEIIKLNFNFSIIESELVKGYVRLLPLDFSLLKRPIRIEELWVNLAANKSPVLNSTIFFNLPEYKIKLLLQGPIASPRYMFESEPPLPQNDIYSVLLFGRPLKDMGSESNQATQQTRQLLSQGLLSLSVLYVLSGTPIEYIGYDAEANEATAQIGLGDKNSLRVSSGQRGNETGVRRSLGRGWYIDSSVLSSKASGSSNNKSANDYGVFLERIISY